MSIGKQKGLQGTLNKDRLRLELMDSLGDEHAAEKLISWCEDEVVRRRGEAV